VDICPRSCQCLFRHSAAGCQACTCDTHCECNSLFHLLLLLCSIFLLCFFIVFVPSFLHFFISLFTFPFTSILLSLKFFHLIYSLYSCLLAGSSIFIVSDLPTNCSIYHFSLISVSLPCLSRTSERQVISAGIQEFTAFYRLIFSPWCNSPKWAKASLLSRLHDHTQAHHIR
jgi:membrane-associated HD superfamily phosphohydrolase